MNATLERETVEKKHIIEDIILISVCYDTDVVKVRKGKKVFNSFIDWHDCSFLIKKDIYYLKDFN